MRGLTRLAEPQILVERKDLWLRSFIESEKSRPDSGKYANPAIKRDLNSMSFHKCFYCETLLKGRPKEVDHHIEVSVDKSLAFEWENLCLSCDNCNNKIPHDKISIHDVLNPCSDDDERIQENLTFEDELILPKNNSEVGLRTIQKYRLDTELLDAMRIRQIKEFYKLIINIREQQLNDGGRELLTDEINAILAFTGRNWPYSLMFTVLIKKNGYLP